MMTERDTGGNTNPSALLSLQYMFGTRLCCHRFCDDDGDDNQSCLFDENRKICSTESVHFLFNCMLLYPSIYHPTQYLPWTKIGKNFLLLFLFAKCFCLIFIASSAYCCRWMDKPPRSMAVLFGVYKKNLFFFCWFSLMPLYLDKLASQHAIEEALCHI